MIKALLTKPLIPSKPTLFITLALFIALVGFISMDIYFPSFPAISDAFAITPGTTQLTLTLFLCGFGISQLFYGPLSDYFGRRPVLLIGFCIYLLGSAGLATTHSTQMLLLTRLIQGIGAGAGASLGRVLLRDKFTGNTMAQMASYLTIGIALATALAPALGGYIQEIFGFRGNFILMLLFGLFVTVFVCIYLPETHQTRSQYSLHPFIIVKNYAALLRNKIFICNMLCSGLALSALIAYAIINPFILQNHLHVSPAHYGLITLCIALGELIGTFINSQCVTTLGYRTMMIIGIALMVLAASLMITLSILNIFNIMSIMVPTFLITMCIGIIIPNATAGAFSTLTSSIGAAGAIYGFFQVLMTVLVTYCIANLPTQTQTELGVIFLVLGLISSILFLLQSHSRQST
ncbi:MAG: multidrug effflux MFS transporter [Gammaproteobacteria bacterium]|nr:multidrug effflux MFS transporter [Gammaproteobacteria bacterium]